MEINGENDCFIALKDHKANSTNTPQTVRKNCAELAKLENPKAIVLESVEKYQYHH